MKSTIISLIPRIDVDSTLLAKLAQKLIELAEFVEQSMNPSDEEQLVWNGYYVGGERPQLACTVSLTEEACLVPNHAVDTEGPNSHLGRVSARVAKTTCGEIRVYEGSGLTGDEPYGGPASSYSIAGITEHIVSVLVTGRAEV